ncbi:hypothetical protein CYLTODRAFT_455252 [Cylindrobasidium torrendii FP15055 ss-10]|uniref:F-box domain-containing protein n=1 Tax=Cylindrobasidium torrendii FP15055 ss-10 TaxID=1314674 RepID=A0A0D7B8S5_9AGAR|nr:hypothetical protein CYLTODRAFT_455252 [Cylindrobasidium torrendii FP15055 ss-10]
MGTGIWSLCSGEQCWCPNHRLPDVIHDQDVLPDDPLVDFLSTSNELPSESDKPALGSLLSSLKEKMAIRDTLIEQLRSMMAKYNAAIATLEEERAQLDNVVNQGTHAFSAVKRVPVEVLQHIFQYTITFPPVVSSGHHEWHSDDSDDSGNPLPQYVLWYDQSKPEDPLCTLTQVSQRWRAIALGNAALHSSLSIHISSNHFSIPQLTNVLQRRFSSLSDAPLSVAITCDPMTIDVLSRHTSRIATALEPYASKIVELFVFLPDAVAEKLEILEGKLPSLTSLLMHNTPRPYDSVHPPHPVFTGCPLRRLVLRDYASPTGSVASIKSSHTWEHIVHLELLITPNEDLHAGPDAEAILTCPCARSPSSHRGYSSRTD